jgi:putative transposase
VVGPGSAGTTRSPSRSSRPLKGECLDQQPWPTRAAARRAAVEDIAWYNSTRLPSALGYKTPDEFETATDEEVVTQAA